MKQGATQQNNSSGDNKNRPSGKISQGLEQLICEVGKNGKSKKRNDFDIVIIGSGYGGSIAADQLSACKTMKICVLERGKEYLPGSFPSSFSEIAGHVRFNMASEKEAKGTQDGLFDFRINTDMSALVGNGLGGGSLINAGVMEIPKAERFNQRWPNNLQNFDDLMPYYEKAKVILGATRRNGTGLNSSVSRIIDNTIRDHRRGLPEKFNAHERLGKKARFRPAAITVAMEDKTSCSGLALKACNYCGDCATGCNFGAKESLDTNLLDRAFQQGAKIICGITVVRLVKEVTPQGRSSSNKAKVRWRIFATYTDKKLRQRQVDPVEITAERVVLAAGVFGSTEILKRSESDSLKFSDKLGSNFSGNGDMLASIYNQKQKVNAISKREKRPTDRKVGPTITGVIEVNTNTQDIPFIIQELAIPNPMREFYEELTTTASALINLRKSDNSRHQAGPVKDDPWAVNSIAIDKSAVIAMFGDDGAGGELVLNDENKENINGNGCLNVKWKDVGNTPVFDQQIATLNRLCEGSEVKGTVIPNPLWKFLPDGMEYLAEGGMRGPLLTVHPLGGCAMADSVEGGVVNEYGCVFNASGSSDSIHEGLVILDGSIIPTALETNPALTIAAVSFRAVDKLIEDWELKQTVAGKKISKRERRLYRDVMDDYNGGKSPTPVPAVPTQLQLIERLGGKVKFQNVDYYLEITLRCRPKNIRELYCSGRKFLKIDPEQRRLEHDSRIRIIEHGKWEQLNNRDFNTSSSESEPGIEAEMYIPDSELESALEHAAVFSAPLSGQITIFNREMSGSLQRRLRAGKAWFFNRGIRDAYQTVEAGIKRFCVNLFGSSKPGPREEIQTNKSRSSIWTNPFQRVAGLWALSSRAGELRTLNYELDIGYDCKAYPDFKPIAKKIERLRKLTGIKRLTYSRCANPWRQLMELRLDNLPGEEKPTLELDTKFLARQGVPLLKIVKQQDQPAAMLDLASFFMYVVRFLLNTHIWSFRQPDPYGDEKVDQSTARANLSEIPKPKTIKLETLYRGEGPPVIAQLTHYKNPGKPPLLAIHGYSIGGSSFTHEAIGTNFVQYFRQDYDIWILDLRTSSNMGGFAGKPWSFEDVAFNDIPVAFSHVFKEAKEQKINVIAHCMGAAMLSMAILKEPVKGDRFHKERKELPDRINCLALSQAGPRINFSPDNLFRAYVLNHMLYFLPTTGSKFRKEGKLTLADRLFDRALSTLPYPEEEYRLENPAWPPWKKTPFTRTRHRADILYGRNFSLKNITDEMLYHLDDLYGSFNTKTISQAIHFARWKTITTKKGYNDFVSRDNLKKRWRFNTFSIHGQDNDLLDSSTMKLMQHSLEDAGLSYKSEILPAFGHLDCLIGRDAKRGFEEIQQFFLNSQSRKHGGQSALPRIPVPRVELPTVGPHIGSWLDDPILQNHKVLPVTVGSSPGMTDSSLIVVVPVKRKRECFEKIKTASGSQNHNFDYSNILSDKNPVNVFAYSVARNKEERKLRKLAVSKDIWDHGADGALVLFVHYDSSLLNDPVFNMSPLFEGDLSMDLTSFCYTGKLSGETKSYTQLAAFLPRFDSLLNKIGPDIDKAISNKLKRPARELERFCIPSPGLMAYSKNQSELPESISFALASCQYPAGILDNEPAFNSYQRLSRLLDEDSTRISFLLLVGDQVYIDATAGLFDPITLGDRYLRPYQMLYRNRYVQEVMCRLPTYNMLDDHEIEDNWEPIPVGTDNHDVNHQYLVTGRNAFRNWQQKYRPQDKSESDNDNLWFDFEQNGFPFFMIDSRTERQHRCAKNIETATLISETQFAALEEWLNKNKGNLKPKFIVSPAMPFPRTRVTSQSGHISAAVQSDSWDGYPTSLDRLIGLIYDGGIQNVIFLSGDTHLSLVSEINISPDKPGSEGHANIKLLSIHSSGMYAPYPFANSRKEDLALKDSFIALENSKRPLNVSVKTKEKDIVPGDGFSVIEIKQVNDRWIIDIVFNRANGPIRISKNLPKLVSTPVSPPVATPDAIV